MLKKAIGSLLAASKAQGWVMEPQAKQILALAGIQVPKFRFAAEAAQACEAAAAIGYPVVGKVVSPRILHKSDLGGVVKGIHTDKALLKAYRRFSKMDGFRGMLVEETLAGVEMILGAKVDLQFGPVILLGIGGTHAEVYQDTSIRMAPVSAQDVVSMVQGLKAHRLIEGFRGGPAVNIPALTAMMLIFSELVMAIEPYIESIDLNPVICTPKACLPADARIVLAETPMV